MLNRHIGIEIRTMVSRLLGRLPTDQRCMRSSVWAAEGQFDAGPDRVTAMEEDETSGSQDGVSARH
jgi:hypothetical protein